MFVGIYDEQGVELARTEDANYEHINDVREIMESIQHAPEDWEDHPSVSVRVAGTAPRRGGQYRFTTARVCGWRMWRASLLSPMQAWPTCAAQSCGPVFYVIGLVLLTTLTLYPVISNPAGETGPHHGGPAGTRTSKLCRCWAAPSPSAIATPTRTTTA